MAPNSGSSHSFQKLKLDTAAAQRPATSTFASIRHESRQNGAHHNHAAQNAAAESQPTASISIPIKRVANGANGAHGRGPYDGSAVIIGSGSEEDSLEARFRQRTKSISFNNEVTLDGGYRLSLDHPLPRPSFKPASRPDSNGEYSEAYLELSLESHERLQHRIGESRYPLLQATVDDLANGAYIEQVASLTSEATESPQDEVRTPLDPPSDYLLSPLPVNCTSPIEFPLFSGRRFGSQRSRSYRETAEGDGSRRNSRRSSARSGRSLSSMSPAASFLSRYKASEAPLKLPEPDDEGQGIGYSGEYIIGKMIGFGGFSVVKEVTSIENGEKVVNAVKVVRRQQRNKSELENEQIQTQFDHEVEIWRYLRHPYILPLICVYQTEFATFCITRLNKGGTLFDLVRDMRKSKNVGLPEHLAKRYIYQLASAMRYLHNDVQVVHRDIKLENCLLDMTGPKAETEGGDVLLCDFGMADFVVSDQRDGVEPQSIGENQNIGPAETSTSIAGSLQYAAPELFSAPGPVFSLAADIWAFGVVVYALLTANLPFNEGLDVKTSTKIRSGQYDIELLRSSEALQGEDAEGAIDLVRGCLELDVERRWTVHDILSCPWLKGCMKLYEHVPREWLAES
ncbi:kinase-like protein [Massarina eburnea CBS 473.64]|uniref:Kinase-like protein n=1 Tax=Massarina eburnea CBS 473.64 TaxID=1395130 RepID=A0A6A6SEZ8_9PLEO|nr:kinase-like protein [Massarina eburnea CBS 473.64]